MLQPIGDLASSSCEIQALDLFATCVSEGRWVEAGWFVWHRSKSYSSAAVLREAVDVVGAIGEIDRVRCYVDVDAAAAGVVAPEELAGAGGYVSKMDLKDADYTYQSVDPYSLALVCAAKTAEVLARAARKIIENCMMKCDCGEVKT